MFWIYICSFICCFQFLHQRVASTVTSTILDSPEYYTAAVFEHNRKGNPAVDTPSQIIGTNLDYYERAVAEAATKNADIIVFPEYGLMPLLSRQEMKNYLQEVPDPKRARINPCNQEKEFADRPILLRLSCISKQNNIVIVANTGDIQPCTKEENPNCPDDNTFHFNANVVFDRDGTILMKYYKEHLIVEPGMDLPQEPQYPVFTTDFGTFATYICFDTIWPPMMDMAKNMTIDNIAVPTMWIDTMALYMSVQWYSAWALENNITLLVSNVNIPGSAAVGSGIFSGYMGALKYTFNPDSLSKLIISKAPRSRQQNFPFPNTNSSIVLITESGPQPYDEDNDGRDVPDECLPYHTGSGNYTCTHENRANHTFVKLTNAQDRLEACNNGMCCSLEYSTEEMHETYYLVVYNGTFNAANRYFFCKEDCYVVRCDDSNDLPCNSFPLRATTVFSKLNLRANFTTKYVYPSILESKMRLSPVNEWTYGTVGEDIVQGHLDYESSSPLPLLVAGFNGRCYDRDVPYK